MLRAGKYWATLFNDEAKCGHHNDNEVGESRRRSCSLLRRASPSGFEIWMAGVGFGGAMWMWLGRGIGVVSWETSRSSANAVPFKQVVTDGPSFWAVRVL